MITIRQARLPDDKPVLIGFIKALQEYEVAFEKNRRLDGNYAEEHFAMLLKDVERGMIFVAEQNDSALVGWAVVHEGHAPVFVTEDERRYAHVAELFVEEAVRGKGVGQALMAACEDWARTHSFATIRIGHLTHNARAGAIYEKAGYASYAVERRKRLK
jgi:GNAT superfamily N-acetyltransferase